MNSSSAYCGMCYAAGLPLAQIVEEMKSFRSLCIQYNQQSVLKSLDLKMQFFLNLMGRSDDPLILTGEAMNEEEAMRQMRERNGLDLVRLHIFKLSLAVYMNDHLAARAICARLREFRKIQATPYYYAITQLFMEGLTASISPRSSKKEQVCAKVVVRVLKRYANHAPANYLHRVMLIQAELAVKANKLEKAIKRFDEAINHAGKERLIHEQALACERTAYALESNNQMVEAETYLRRACSLYCEWGATAKVDQLSELLLDWRNK